MQRVLHEQPPPPYEPININHWQRQMLGRITEWHNSRPAHGNMSRFDKGVVDTFQVTFQTAVFNLFRPSTNIPSPSGSQLVTMTHAAIKMIQLYRKFFCSRQLSIYWQAMENLYSAGTCLMFAFVHSAEVREQLPSLSFSSLVHSCSSVLWGMAERFPPYLGKRDAFDKAASKVLQDLGLAAEPPNPWDVQFETDGIQRASHLLQEGHQSAEMLPPPSASVEDVLQDPQLRFPAFANINDPSGNDSTVPFTDQGFYDTPMNWDIPSEPHGLFAPLCTL